MKSEPTMIFYGSTILAVPILNELIKNFHVVAVITNPDNLIGKNKTINVSEVKKIATNNKIPYFTPNKLDSRFFEQIASINADIGIVAAYGKIIPKQYLEHPFVGCFNVHPSLLPRYRGATPIQSAIKDGLKQTGFTIIKMNEGLDDGDIVHSVNIEINENDNSLTLLERIGHIVSYEIIDLIPKLINKKISPIKQDKQMATYCYIKDFTFEKGQIDWNQSVDKVQSHIRAFSPEPRAWSIFQSKKIFILDAQILDTQETMFNKAGYLYKVNDMLIVGCIEGNLLIKSLQIEGKKTISAKDFINGHQKDLPYNLLTI